MLAPINVTLPPKNIDVTSIVEFAHQSALPYQFQFYNPAPSIDLTANPVDAGSLLAELCKLQADWDGYGALPISSESVAHARRFVSTMPQPMPVPEISPTSNGTISLEWGTLCGEAYIEIGRTRYSGHIRPRNGKTVYLEGQLTGPAQQNVATEQALLVIQQLLYGASGSIPLTRSTQIAEPAI